MKFPSEEELEKIRTKYPEGTRIELIRMDDPYSGLRPGDRGTVQYVDDAGTVHMKWDKGSGLGLIPGIDDFLPICQPTRILNHRVKTTKLSSSNTKVSVHPCLEIVNFLSTWMENSSSEKL